MEKKFAKKIATYAMAATMIGGAVIGSGSTGVFAAEKYPSSATAKSAYSKVMSNTGTNYKKSRLKRLYLIMDIFSQIIC